MRRGAALLAASVLALAAAGCGSSSSQPSDQADSAPASSGAPIPGGGLSVEEALASTLDGPLAVAGYLVEQDGTLLLCSELTESDPPGCGGASLEVEGDVDAADVGQQVSLLGEVDDGVLTIAATALS